MASMRERATELGGSLEAGPARSLRSARSAADEDDPSSHLSTSTLYVSVSGPPDSANERSGLPVAVDATDPMD